MAQPSKDDTSKSIINTLEKWGKSSVPPSVLAALSIALSRPGGRTRWTPMLLGVALFGGTYVHLAGYPTDGAAYTAGLSGVYALAAMRGRPSMLSGGWFSVRGAVRAVSIGVASVNTVAGSYVFMTGNREKDRAAREQANRWGDG